MAKAALLFLLAMVLLAFLSRLVSRPKKHRNQLTGSPTCPRCGSFIIGKGPCVCEKGRK